MTLSNQQGTVFIAGGGTGGHIYPALAIASAIEKNNSKIKVHFVGSSYGMECQIIPKHNYPLHLIKIGRLNKNVSRWQRLLTLFQLPLALIKSFLLIVKHKPQFVLGVGGYASAPVVLVAALLKRKTYIWEPNAIPGLANRWLSRFVPEALIVFPEAESFLRSHAYRKVGLPVRSAMTPQSKSAPTKGGPLNILIFGGSQGARGINETVSQALISENDVFKNIHVIHQTGPKDFDRISKLYEKENLSENIQVHSYLDNIETQYHWADLIFCRAGVSTIAELAALGKPAVLIPFPFASDNHQQKNAEALLSKEACEMILQKEFTVQAFIKTVNNYLHEPDRLVRLSENIKQFHTVDASQSIANYLLNHQESSLEG